MAVLDYESPSQRARRRDSRGVVTLWLIAINVLVFFIDPYLARAEALPQYILTTERGLPVMVMNPLKAWGYFAADVALEQLQVWRFVTFQFLHAGLGHLATNMIGLFFFGPLVEGYLGSRRFLLFYLICGIAGPLAYLLLWGADILVGASWIPLVGASAGIFGILAAAARIAPDVYVMLLLPPIPMKLKTLAWVLLGIALFTVLSGGNNAGGEAAHIGGAVAGYFLIRRPYLLGYARRSTHQENVDIYG